MVFLSTLFIVVIILIAWWLNAYLDRREEAGWNKHQKSQEK